MTVALNIAILMNQDAWSKRNWAALSRECGVNAQQLRDHAAKLEAMRR